MMEAVLVGFGFWVASLLVLGVLIWVLMHRWLHGKL
jgi:hypothetical protein